MVTVSNLYVPDFVTITHIADDRTGDAEYVISNEATGKFFLANRPTVTLLDALNRFQSLPDAVQEAQLTPDHSKQLLDQMMRFGVVVLRGQTQNPEAPKSPIESKVISLRFDLFDAAQLTRKFETFGRAAYSRIGGAVWSLLIIAMVYALATNGDKAVFAMQQVPNAGWADIARFAVLIAGLKIIHEMGHALAYRTMCLREGHDPGPIRMGISIFALTPFPFTDVTGAWRLRSSTRRAIIGAGGLYFELGATALLTLFWAQTGSGPLQVTIFQVATFTAATTILFNLNPAVKLDGYYVLSDLTRQYNIAGRGSLAARQWLARLLGAATPQPDKPFLAYWVFSYLYRWTLFAGIFWIFYQMDQRLAVPIAVIICMTLIARPLWASLKFARATGAKTMNIAIAGGCLAAVLGLCFVPYPDRLLLDGRTTVHDTRFIYAPETAQVTLSNQTSALPQIDLVNPDLVFQAQDLVLRRAILENAARSVTGSAAEKSRLEGDVASLSKLNDELEARLARLHVEKSPNEVWDIRAAQRFDGAWTTPQSGVPLAVISRPAALRVLLWLEQARVEQDMFDTLGTTVQVRIAADPACSFGARIDGPLSGAAQSEVFNLTAFPLGEPPNCLTAFKNGAAVVARLDTAPKSLFDRGRRTVLRLLQNRLPGQELN